MSYDELCNYLDHYLNRLSLKFPPEADFDWLEINRAYSLACKSEDNSEALDLLKNAYLKAKIAEFKYSGEAEILKNIPDYNYLFKFLEKIQSLDNIDEKLDLFDSFTHQKVNTVRLVYKLEDEEIEIEPDLKSDILNSIKLTYEDFDVRKSLSNEELYSLLINYYKLKIDRISVKEIEINISDIMRKVWANALTDPTKFKNGDSFCFLVHNFTTHASFSEQMKIMKEMRLGRVSSSLITDNFVGMYNSKAGRRVGLIYDPSAEIVTTGKHDLYTYEVDEHKVVRNKEYASSALSPAFLEEFGIKLTSSIGEDLYYTEIYNEVLLGDAKPVAVFLIGYGEKDLNPDYEDAKKLASDLDIPFLEIDLSVYKERKGLPILDENAKKYIAKQVVFSAFGLKQNGIRDTEKIKMMYQMIGSYYEELGDIYIKLKEKGEATKENMMLAFYQLFQNRAENNLDQSVNDNNPDKIR